MSLPQQVNKNKNDIQTLNDDANLVRGRVTLLENANMVKSVSYETLTHKITFTFYDNTTQLLDLPLESTIVGASYNNAAKDITFTLQNGSTLIVPLDDLVSGLPSEAWVNTYFIPKTSIVDNLTTNDATKVLSANQGKVLKEYINGLYFDNLPPLDIITPEMTSFILSTSTNKFNKSTVLSGHVIPSGSGTPTANAAYSVSDFIGVSPSQIITVYGATRITVFDIDKSYLAHFTIAANTSNMRTMPSGAKYVRLSVDNNLFDECQMNIGDTLLPYEPYSLTLDPSIRVTGIDEEPKEIDLWVEDRYVIEGEVRGNITGQAIPALPTWASYTTSDIISLYDNLTSANTDYISKSILGTDSLGENIYRYDFKPQPVPTEYVSDDKLKTKFPKMILIAGIHGSEKAGVYNLFQALKQITENWEEDELLETLRWNCHFIVVPIVSNYGYNNTQRKNENGVDLARNFPERWKLTDPSDSTYGGPSPLSENGSQLIAQLLQDNKEDTIYFTSHHNFGSGTNNFIWNASATKLQVHLGRQLVSKMTRKWKKQYSWMPQDEVTYVGYSDDNAPSGSEAVYASSLGIQASTFEVNHEMPFESSPQMYNSMALTLGAETLLNWLLINLKNNVDFYNNIK